MPPPPSTGTVTVTNLPSGGTIVALGQRRAASFELPPGEHQVELRAPGYEVQRTPVTVRAGGDITLPFVAPRVQQSSRPPPVERRPADAAAAPPTTRAAEPAAGGAVPLPTPAATTTAMLQIAVRPAAQVFIDGQALGERTRFQHEVRADVPHALRFMKDGYVTLDTLVTVQAGGRQVVNIALRPAP